MTVLDIIFDVRVASAIVGILIYLIYRFSTRNHSYWKERGIPFVKPYPFIGSFYETFKKNVENLDVERHQKLGRIYGFYEATNPTLIIAEPELLKNILVKDFQYFSSRRIFETGDPVIDNMVSALGGEDWKRVRSIVTPTFSTGKIKRVMSIFQECARTTMQNFKTGATKDEPMDVLKIYGAFTIDVIASSAFSTKIDSHNDPENIFLVKSQAVFNNKIGIKMVFFLLCPTLMKKLNIGVFSSDTVEFFKNAALAIIEERKRTGQKRNDFMQLLMDSANEVAKEEKWDAKSEEIVANYGDDSFNHPIFKNTSTKYLSVAEMVAQCVVFFFAGYHTTSTTLTIASYLLALNQNEQQKLYEEIKDVLEETNGELKYESIQKMKYLDNVISETLRLYAPGIRADRTATDDYKLGDTGIIIPKGMVVSVPIFALHRDPKFFPEPERFNPDRFTPEERAKQIPYSYLPFGAGPRNCVAMRFALLELKVCLIYVFSTFHVKKCPETKLEFGNKGQGTLHLFPVKLRMEVREDCPLKT